MNITVIVGRLTADPESRTTSTGKATCSFSVAVDRAFSKSDSPQADFFKVVSWEKTAEFVGKYLKKGRSVAVSGRMEQRSYDKDGSKVYIWELIADKVDSLDKNPDSSGNRPTPNTNADEYDPFA